MSKNNRICIVGSGVLGSYSANLFSTLGYEVDLYEIGSSQIKNEKEIGFKSIIRTDYNGTKKGRFFGFGGTSEMWGGQILLFDDKDFNNPDPFTLKLVELNKYYSQTIYERLGIKNLKDNTDMPKETSLGSEKKGYWLNPRKRNIFKLFNLKKKPNIRLFPEHALIKIKEENNQISELHFRVNKKVNIVTGYQSYIIAIGAIEHARHYMLSKNLRITTLKDHLSVKLAQIKSEGLILDHDLKFQITPDRSLITKRIIGELNNNSYFLHPIFNEQVPLFKFLKSLLFKKQFNLKFFLDSFNNISDSIIFLVKIGIFKKFTVFNNLWSLQLDFETETALKVELDEEQLDDYDLPSLIISKDSESQEIIQIDLENKISALIEKGEIIGELHSNSVGMRKSEDTYHPYSLIPYNSFEDYLNEYHNGLIISTAILPRIGGINPTASLLPVIEYYAANKI
jgi:hypothetical protein